jgi:hypothetical protein
MHVHYELSANQRQCRPSSVPLSPPSGRDRLKREGRILSTAGALSLQRNLEMRKLATAIGLGSLTVILLAGCMESLSEQGKKDPNSIIGKTTDDIKEFDPKAKQALSDSKVRADDPMFYALQAYGPAVEQLEKANVKHTVDIFEATEGHYPKDYNEFMTRIVKANQMRLPVLPGGWQYAYDVPNHELKVVHPVDDAGRPIDAPPPAASQNSPVGTLPKIPGR